MPSPDPAPVATPSGTPAPGPADPVPPGTVHTRGWRPRWHWELIACGFNGHELLGTDVATLRPADALVAREPGDGLRWYRCLRCDGWIPLVPPEHPAREHLPERSDVVLPLRGRPLRDRYVLRLIALDRLLHFLVLGAGAALVLLFIARRSAYTGTFYAVLDALQSVLGGPDGFRGGGLLREVSRAFTARESTLWLVALVLAGYAVLEGVEAIGLWLARRWAEYLTFVATAALMVPEIWELTGTVTVTKVITLVVNLAVVIYLLVAKRLFGVRGGGRREAREREYDSGWSALERTAPAATTGSAGELAD